MNRQFIQTKQGSNQYKMKHGFRNKSLVAIFLSILLICFSIYAFKQINNWFNHNYFEFKTPVEVKFNPLVTIKIRKPDIIKVVVNNSNIKLDTPIKKRICEVFGDFECKTAIAVASVEGLNHPIDSFNTNTNGTIDVGYFRINSVHFNQPGCSLKEVITEEGNIQCAYSIWKASGWNAWVGFNNGNFRSKL